jgi:mono/diheme cytochrome c family protein
VSGRRIRIAGLLILGLSLTAAILPALRLFWWARESNPVRRGAAIAARAGCLSCHGPQGTRGLPDPGLGAEVPAWTGGVPMMYVSGAEEIREYILDGVSRRREQSAAAREERARAAIRMPGYRDLLSSRQVGDLVAYVLAVSQLRPIDDPVAARGREIVVRERCESCHGVAGSGGVRNPASFKGYVPGWIGSDFSELVRDDGELRQWILDGGIDRFASDRLAVHFLARQRLQMPSYGKKLPPEETGAIIAYIRWLRKSS